MTQKTFFIKEICVRDPFLFPCGNDIDINPLSTSAIASIFYQNKKETVAFNFFYEITGEKGWKNCFVYLNITESFEYTIDKDDSINTPEEVLLEIRRRMDELSANFKKSFIQIKNNLKDYNDFIMSVGEKVA